ncbi:G2/M phase-specific E3 ubiquitin-protein ligase [Oryzias melastigma]|uniref:G2/M phase-specific E3 ubiquitin-protein ligase n=1 Tax=Oryzias melastigma TaxID=30732 RepID=A0A834C4U3_ORYME|nr:G2/M phase-specific E3 ubiquitin-protein ligase [Oryzias melastigma]
MDLKKAVMLCIMQKVLEAASDESLQNIILQNSTMFQTAGCLRVVRTCEKHAFVEEYLRWYIIDRNHSCIQRFRDGLASLDFFSALQQHSSVLAPVLSYSCKVLTASDMENMFIPDLSPPGSNRRQKEGKTLGFWEDYLSDSEEKLTAVSLEELLMFATGLASLPPAGMRPTPQIQFTSESPFPVANTCANVMKLPFVDS